VRESAASAKRVCFMFGAKPAQSETPVRAAAKRRTPGRGAVEGRRGATVGFRLLVPSQCKLLNVNALVVFSRSCKPLYRKTFLYKRVPI